MDVLVNEFDTPLCAASRPRCFGLRSHSARVTLPLAVVLPATAWLAVLAASPARAEGTLLAFLVFHLAGVGLALFSLSRAFIYGQKRLAAAAAAIMVAAALPAATVVSALLKIRVA